MQINLSLKHHAFIISLLPDRGRVDVIRYINQISNEAIFPVDEAQMIKVEVPSDLVHHVYFVMGNVSERYAASMNLAIKTALLPQLNDAQLLQKIQDIQSENISVVSSIVQRGYDFLQSVKQ